MNDTPDLTAPEAVKRYDMAYGGQDTWMGECENGDFVYYDDYVALSAMLRACKGRGELYALVQIAMDALEEAEAILGGEYGDQYGPLCAQMGDMRHRLAALEPTPDHAEWNAAIEAAANACISAIGGVTHYGSEPYEICAAATRQLKKGQTND